MRVIKIALFKAFRANLCDSFYEALGFKVQDEVYQDCGIPHIDMTLALS